MGFSSIEATELDGWVYYIEEKDAYYTVFCRVSTSGGEIEVVEE